MYCPKCKSRLYPDDEKSMRYAGVCSGCVSFDSTLGKIYREAYRRGAEAEAKKMKKNKRYH